MKKIFPRLARANVFALGALLVWGVSSAHAVQLTVENYVATTVWMSTNAGGTRWGLPAGASTLEVAPGSYDFQTDLLAAPITVTISDVADMGAQRVQCYLTAGAFDVAIITEHSTWQWYLYGFGYGFVVCGFGWVISILRMARTESCHEI